jgi:hypothetical protein
MHCTTESHAYPSRSWCGTPTTCRDAAHWSANDDTAETLAEAHDLTKLDDAPAMRLVAVDDDGTRTVVEVVAGGWSAQEIADCIARDRG